MLTACWFPASDRGADPAYKTEHNFQTTIFTGRNIFSSANTVDRAGTAQKGCRPWITAFDQAITVSGTVIIDN